MAQLARRLPDRQVAAILAKRFGEAAILYDKFHKAEFARDDLVAYLTKLYRDDSELIVAVLCPDYDKKAFHHRGPRGAQRTAFQSSVYLCVLCGKKSLSYFSKLTHELCGRGNNGGR